MSRMIDADHLRRWIIKRGLEYQLHPADILDQIDRELTIEPERTGKWIVYESDNDKYEDIRCPFCKFIYTVDAYHWTDIGFTKDDLEHCPHCGARMEA